LASSSSLAYRNAQGSLHQFSFMKYANEAQHGDTAQGTIVTIVRNCLSAFVLHGELTVRPNHSYPDVQSGAAVMVEAAASVDRTLQGGDRSCNLSELS
jgi:hypothetical protein